MLHVTFAAVTVRLLPAACEAFCATLLEAMQQLTIKRGKAHRPSAG